MSNQSFGEAVTKLAKLYNLDNVVCTAADSDTGEGCTLIKGNNAKLLIMLAVSTLKDVSEKVGMDELEQLVELAEHEANKQSQSKEDQMEELFNNASKESKKEMESVLDEIKKALGL